MTLPGGQSRLRAASASFLSARRPRLSHRPRPFSAAAPRVRGAFAGARSPADAEAERGTEGSLQTEEEAALASAQAQKRASGCCRRRPRAEEGSESRRVGLAEGEAAPRGGQRRVAIRDVEEHGVVGPLPEGGRGRI